MTAFVARCDIVESMKPSEVKRSRTQLGLSVQEFAKELGVHRATVHRWENGDSTVSKPIGQLIRTMVQQKRGAA